MKIRASHLVISALLLGLVYLFGLHGTKKNQIENATSGVNVDTYSEQAPPPPVSDSPQTIEHLRSAPTELPTRKMTNVLVNHARPEALGVAATRADSVDYKIEGDLAISFGDIVLGAPKSASMPGIGQVKPNKIHFWDSGQIPFYIQPSLPNPERVIQALEGFRQTPVSFIPYTNQKDALVFQARPGNCKSYLGKMGGLQPIFLSDNCYASEITHEVMHALGFIHEHSRTDRDRYVEVLWTNIDESFKSQFTVVPEDLMEPLKGTPFDFQSIMIYEPTAFARDKGSITLRSRSNELIHPADTLSAHDIERLTTLYSQKR